MALSTASNAPRATAMLIVGAKGAWTIGGEAESTRTMSFPDDWNFTTRIPELLS